MSAATVGSGAVSPLQLDLAEHSRLTMRLLQSVFPDRSDSPAARQELVGQLRQAADRIEEELAAQSNGEGAGRGSEELDEPRPSQQPSGRITKKQRKGKAHRDFDFSRYCQRYIALEVLYLGWTFHGFASVADSDNTIEAHLFRALEKTRLIDADADRRSLQYSRCGRTDKGVSALGQVVVLNVRSAARAAEGLASVSLEEELDYPGMLNRALPPEIRVLGWATANPSFSARFDALWREYKYFILPPPGSSIAAMQEAANHFVGLHDFRHFCKLDAANVNNFVRRIEFFRVSPVEGCSWPGDRQLCELHLRGSAFLWHQVRCMAAVLLMVGQGAEAPSVVAQFLDVEAEPRKPLYSMAHEDPLILYACGFESLDFRRTPGLQAANCEIVDGMLQQHLIKAGMLLSVSERLRSDSTTGSDKVEKRAPKHTPLSERGREPTVEERLARYGKVPVRLRDLALTVQPSEQPGASFPPHSPGQPGAAGRSLTMADNTLAQAAT